MRDRRLRPGPGSSREEVERSQRLRLFGATVAVTASKGYADTSVGDLLEVSGVSRKDFYRHFTNKNECFLATVDEVLNGAFAVTASRLRHDGSWEERAERALTTFFELLAEQPAAARLCLVEAYAAGPAAIARVDGALRRFQALAGKVFEERAGHRGMPEEILRGLIGGLRKIIHARLYQGRERELLGLAPALVRLGLSYRPPPRPLRQPTSRSAPRSINGLDPSNGDASERIAQATLTIVAENGYPETRVADIAACARVSLRTFYQYFDGKAEAFDAALYAGRSRMQGYSQPIYRRARNWPEGIRAVTEASLSYLAAEPEFAKLICVDVYAAGPDALERRDQAVAAAQRLIEDGVERYSPQMEPIWREGIISALYAMLCDWVDTRGPATLLQMAPLATYVALAPFLGAEAACNVANGRNAVKI